MGKAVPITDVRDIAHIAYGFKASKALFSAIDLGIFGHLAGSAKSLSALSALTAVPPNRLEALLTALCGLALLSKTDDCYRNAPACDEYLVPGKRGYFGDYFRLQTDKFIFPAFVHLTTLLTDGQTSTQWGKYDALMRDPVEADAFSRGQHSGSLGPAAALAKKLDVSTWKAVLDVGGGSGAFTIMLCKRNPSLRSTIFDFPQALSVAREYVEQEGLSDRVLFAAGDVLQTQWPLGHDVVLMSYLLSAVDGDAIDMLTSRSFAAVAPGGTLVVHDFIVDDDKSGPRDAALWFLTCLFNAPGAIVLSPERLAKSLEQAGFVGVTVGPLIPGLTGIVQGFRPR